MRVLISNRIVITGPSWELYHWCNENLVVTNPKWQTLVKLGKLDQITRFHIVRDMHLFVEKGDQLILPFGCLYAIWPFIKDCEYRLKFNESDDISCKNDKITQPLYDYQEEAVKKMIEAKSGILIGGCGSGKTNCGVEIAHRIGKKFLWLTHTKDLVKQSYDRFKKLYPNMKLGITGDGKINFGEDGTIATVQTMEKLDPEIYRNEFEVVITDECFPAETKISTKDGYKNIEDIKVGDYVLSYNHKTKETEYKKVLNLFVKTSSLLSQIKFDDKILIATKNHPIYTKRGYVTMEDLKYGDYVLQSVWQRSEKRRNNRIEMVSCEEKGLYLLQSSMCDKKQEKAILVSRDERENVKTYDLSKFESSSFSRKTQDDERKQSNEQFGNSSKNDSNKRKEWNVASTNSKSRRKWEDITMSNVSQSRTSTNGISNSDGISSENSQNKRAKEHLSNLLQDRHSNSKYDDSNRDRWRGPLWRESESEGHKEEQFLVWTRVESIQNYEQSNQEECDGSCTVYNIEVEDNNNYFANDILVHNCHKISGSPTLQKMFVKVIDKIPARYKYGLTASKKRNDTLTKTMYATVGCNPNGEFVPVWEINREDANTLTAKHEKIELDTPFSYDMLNDDGSFNFPGLVDYIAKNKERNEAIVNKIVETSKEDRKQLVLCARIEQCELLHQMLLDSGVKSELLIGKVSAKKRENVLKEKTDWEVIVATISLAKEGLDVPALDTLHLVSCISNQSDTVQSVGRIERVKEGKKEPIVYDYVDINIPYLVSKYKKRVNWLKRR